MKTPLAKLIILMCSAICRLKIFKADFLCHFNLSVFDFKSISPLNRIRYIYAPKNCSCQVLLGPSLLFFPLPTSTSSPALLCWWHPLCARSSTGACLGNIGLVGYMNWIEVLRLWNWKEWKAREQHWSQPIPFRFFLLFWQQSSWFWFGWKSMGARKCSKYSWKITNFLDHAERPEVRLQAQKWNLKIFMCIQI